MKIIITENAEKRLLRQLYVEEVGGMSDKVNLIKDFLDSNFLRATNSTIGEDGYPKLHDIVIWVDNFKEPKQYMNDTDLFYLLQDRFKNILPPDETDDESSEAQDGVNDIMDKAYSDAKKEIKKVTHNNRDNFLKQCIKDWYYKKISKSGNLSLYEDRMSNFGRGGNTVVRGDMKSSMKDIIALAQTKDSKEMKFQDWDDITVNGTQIIVDINRELAAFNRKKSHAGLTMNVLICDRTAGLNSPDLYMLLKMIYTSRSAFKWCILCPNLAKGLDVNTLNQIKRNINSVVIQNGQSDYFKTIEDRNAVLSFLPTYMKRQVPFMKSELKNEVSAASEMTPELNVKVEEYLDSVGFEKTQYDPHIFLNDTEDDDLGLEDFD